ncbi:hypothetical protein EMCG_07651 [[Emmonsia] crescens]|uniref:Uncharacterized protein n=1 Tax=[Emmonsia] crescens TaxID=73230 RepID=A0A0G2JB11_9EURO|nr:hypothetical protein EMCG_07651 [Emmonsia crescens UAMH 3008]
MQQSNPTEFIPNHCQLLEWQDTLEFFCFTLYYTIVQEPRWRCYQAAELCECAGELIKACRDESGKLYPLIQPKERRLLEGNLRQIRQIRHAVAHRLPQTERSMYLKKTLAEAAITRLERLIRASAARHGIRSMEWYPVTASREQNCQAVTIKLDGPSILSARQMSLGRLTAEATALPAPEEVRGPEKHSKKKKKEKNQNCQEDERLEQAPEKHEIDRHHNQLEFEDIAIYNRLRRRLEHLQNVLATRARQLEQIHQAKRYEEFALQQLTCISSQGDNDGVSSGFILAVLIVSASLVFYF